MEYTSEIDIMEYLKQLDLKLSFLEVKGESVIHLFHARTLLKELHDNVTEQKRQVEKEE